jgi:UDP-glucose 4-epimerase
MKKRILVTGGFGFIGGHLIELLLKDKDAQVHVVDNLSSNPIPLDILLDELGHPAGLTYDICSVEEFCRTQPDSKFNEIYHLASPVGPAGVLKFTGKMIKCIVDDAYCLMDMAIRNKARLVDISTSEVYGGGRDGYCSEECSKIVPPKTTARLEYAIGKLAAETAIINTCKVTELDACIIRPFNIAGPRQSGKGGFVLPRFIALAMEGKPLTVFCDGKQIRAFTHVKEMADGIIRVMKFGKTGEAYNLGNPHNKTTILDLAKAVVKVVDTKSTIVFVDPKDIYGPLYEEANDKYPDSDKAMQELKWDPTKDVETTIKETYAYMKAVDPSVFEMLSGKSSVK